jgi:hypothetical protein
VKLMLSTQATASDALDNGSPDPPTGFVGSNNRFSARRSLIRSGDPAPQGTLIQVRRDEHGMAPDN